MDRELLKSLAQHDQNTAEIMGMIDSPVVFGLRDAIMAELDIEDKCPVYSLIRLLAGWALVELSSRIIQESENETR